MSCCSGGCSCEKQTRITTKEQMFLAQMDATREIHATHNWIQGLSGLKVEEEIIEVRFRNNRKEFFRNGRVLRLQKDDRVVVNAEGGHDVGTVSLTGAVAGKRLIKHAPGTQRTWLSQVIRVANETDIETWLNARKKDRPALLACRDIVDVLGLPITIKDVECRGDGKKITVQYSADGIADPGTLLKLLKKKFELNIELQRVGSGHLPSPRHQDSCLS